jgi:glutathione peroxidase
MDRRGFILSLALAPVAVRAGAQEAERFVFASIDGGELNLAAFRGGPVLVVNTASFCSHTPQYNALQDLWDRYRGRGLTVVGVPSQSFGQELDSSGAVKDFCEVNFGINFPMTELVEVVGPEAHPFFAWAQAEGAAPRWNFHKILLDGEGAIAGDFGSTVKPDAPELVLAIEALLPRG